MTGPTGGVKVELDQTYTLRYTTPSFIRMEEATGLTLSEMQDRLEAGSVRAIVALVWGGLLHAEPALTLERAAERVDLRKMEAVATACGKALVAALGEEDADAGNVEAVASTG